MDVCCCGFSFLERGLFASLDAGFFSDSRSLADGVRMSGEWNAGRGNEQWRLEMCIPAGSAGHDVCTFFGGEGQKEVCIIWM
jgi:hypothetical protein